MSHESLPLISHKHLTPIPGLWTHDKKISWHLMSPNLHSRTRKSRPVFSPSTCANSASYYVSITPYGHVMFLTIALTKRKWLSLILKTQLSLKSCLPPWPLSVAQFLVFRCQAFTVLSSEPDITFSPSRVNTRHKTELVWPSYTAWHSSVVSDQTRTVPSLEPVNTSPFGDTTTELISPK